MGWVVGIRACGDTGLLVEVDDHVTALGLRDALRRSPPPGLVDLVPAARTVLVRVTPGTDLRRLAATVRATDLRPPREDRAARPVLEVPVVYDGDDLESVAELTGLTVREVIAAHCGQEWTVAFAGFAPGFGYLVGADRRLTVPRHATPRTAVPAGAVALAGEFSGVYPRESPGGWRILGRTSLRTWDVEEDPPAAMTPGVAVRFVER